MSSETMGRGEGRLERKREAEDAGAQVMVALGVVFVLVSASIGVYSGVFFAGFPFWFPAAILLTLGVSRLVKRRRALPKATPESKERELLTAIRYNGSLTAAEVAMETSLTVREADEMLSGLASGGHLLVGSEDGSLRYSLPGRRA